MSVLKAAAKAEKKSEPKKAEQKKAEPKKEEKVWNWFCFCFCFRFLIVFLSFQEACCCCQGCRSCQEGGKEACCREEGCCSCQGPCCQGCAQEEVNEQRGIVFIPFSRKSLIQFPSFESLWFNSLVSSQLFFFWKSWFERRGVLSFWSGRKMFLILLACMAVWVSATSFKSILWIDFSFFSLCLFVFHFWRKKKKKKLLFFSRQILGPSKLVWFRMEPPFRSS